MLIRECITAKNVKKVLSRRVTPIATTKVFIRMSSINARLVAKKSGSLRHIFEKFMVKKSW